MPKYRIIFRVHVKNVPFFAPCILCNLFLAAGRWYVPVNYKMTVFCEADIRHKSKLKGDVGAKDPSDVGSTGDCMETKQEMCMSEMM